MSLPLAIEDPEPAVYVTGMGDSSVDLLVAPWCIPADYWPVRFEM